MKPKLLFIKARDASFIRQDEDMLSRDFRLRVFTFGSQRGVVKMALRQLRFLGWLLVNLPGARYTFTWFADYHSLLPAFLSRIFGAKSLLVIGGYDAASIPEYNYGGHNKPLRSKFIQWSCRYAHRILHVSQATWSGLSARIGARYEGKYVLVYNGVDTSAFPGARAGSPRNGVICVSGSEDVNRLMIKGLDYLCEVAAQLPEVPFLVAGVKGEAESWMEAHMTPNVKLSPWVERSSLPELYASAKVIVQFSRSESFGMVVAEGMLMGCVPVVFDGSGLMEVVGESGLVVKMGKVEEAVAAVKRALEPGFHPTENGRERVLNHFSLERRSARIREVMADL